MRKKNRKYNCVIFDWDGTIMDSAGQIVSAVIDSAKKNGLNVPSDQSVRVGIGTSFEAQYERLFLHDKTQGKRDYANEVFTSFQKDFYHVYNSNTPKLFPGVEDIIAELNADGVITAIATSGTRAMLNSMLTKFKLNDSFLFTCCGDEFPAKPNPDMLEQILLESDFLSKDAVMLGDSVYDIYSANNAHIDSYGVATGVSSKNDLVGAGAIEVVDDIREIVAYL